jgi:hypothetical protein
MSLMQLYLFVDYDQAVFKLGVLSKDDIGENAVSSGTCTNDERLSATNIGLIVLGIVVFLLLCSLLFLYGWWWKVRHPSQSPEPGVGTSSSPSIAVTEQQTTPIIPPVDPTILEV